MTPNEVKKKIFVTSLVLTILIFTIGLLMSYVLDFYRMDEISREIETHEVDKAAYFLEQEFIEFIGGDKCAVMNQRFFDLKTDIHKVGIALNSFGGRSMMKTIDFDYLKRHYFLLELEFFSLIKKLNRDCDADYVTIMFFYERDHGESLTQDFVSDDVSQSYKDNVVVLSLDKDYEDEPLVPSLVKSHNITTAPTMIINDIKIEEFKYGGEINATIKEIIRNSTTDKYAQDYDFNYLFQSIGINKTQYIEETNKILDEAKINYSLDSNNSLTIAELTFMLGRLTENVSMMCDSLKYYDQAALETQDEELKAIIYETTVAIGCGRNKKAFLELASNSWKKVGNNIRAEIDHALANNKPLPISFKTNFEFSATQAEETLSDKPPLKELKKANTMALGKTMVEITNKDIIVSQVDRVTRDWLGLEIKNPTSKEILATFSEKLIYDKEELREDIGWHEGGRIKELKLTGVENKLATGTIVMENAGKWFAPNEKGEFIFEVPLDKVLYPTTRFLRKDVAIIIDTHGINMLVEQAIRKNASIVIGCCDHPAKIKAATYLAKKNKKVICFTDKFSYLMLKNQDTKTKNNVLMSPPLKIIETDNGKGGKAIIGGQPLKINLNEKIIVVNSTNKPYALWYYQTPADYFSELSKITKIKPVYITINDFNQTERLTKAAIDNNADVIATRIFNSDDYHKLKSWLNTSIQNNAILFHSAPYPYGYLMFKEFPNQVTFGDINVEFS